MNRALVSLLIIVCICSVTVDSFAQSRRRSAPPQSKTTAVRAAETVEPEPEVDIPSVFSISTTAENWTIDQPVSKVSCRFDNASMPFDQRQVNIVPIGENENQYLFPVSWFEPYQGKDPALKYVVVKTKNGQIYSIMAEFLPKRFSLPSEGFEPYTDGKSLYKDVAVYRKDGSVYLKQAVTSGEQDGQGGYYVDIMVIYKLKE